MKRDVLASRDGLSKRDSVNRRDSFGKRQPHPPQPEMLVERAPNAHEEPTWEVRRPGRGRRRLDGRAQSILSAAAVAAIVVNAGAAWAYWRFTASETGSPGAGSAVELTMRGRSDLNKPLTPGGTGNLTVTLTNDNEFPIRITSVSPGAGNIVADDEHRDAGCRVDTGVSVTRRAFHVSWGVEKNTIGAFTISKGLRMDPNANRACAGATFTIPVRVTGVSVSS